MVQLPMFPEQGDNTTMSTENWKAAMKIVSLSAGHTYRSAKHLILSLVGNILHPPSISLTRFDPKRHQPRKPLPSGRPSRPNYQCPLHRAFAPPYSTAEIMFRSPMPMSQWHRTKALQ